MYTNYCCETQIEINKKIIIINLFYYYFPFNAVWDTLTYMPINWMSFIISKEKRKIG